MSANRTPRPLNPKTCPACGESHEVAATLLGTPLIVCPDSSPERAMRWFDGLIVVGGKSAKK
jgi:hypothetical protein